ncbi:MAG: DHHA1 domain-containing protein [Gemmatimonadaceae bacterium]
MTNRLYYTDSYQKAFRATIVGRDNDGKRLYLDQTAFYPTSGGQLNDLGTINGVQVLDVIDEDARVAHVLASAVPDDATAIDGEIDWARRYDFMQQHTGQHLLSAMFEDRYGWPTVSVHFGTESSTLDITAPNWDASKLEEAERIANELAAENREILVTFEDAASAGGLRKASDRDGTLRIIAIADVDRSACGGTHVRRTGEVGAILLRRAEKNKTFLRVEFLCGRRAVSAARRDAALLTRTAAIFTAATEEVPRLVEAQQQQLKELERENKRLKGELATYEARKLWDAAAVDTSGVRRIYVQLASGPVKEQEPLAQAIAALGGAVVVITSIAPVGVMLASSADSNVDAGKTIRDVVAPHGGRGGGSPRLAQASLPDASALPAVAAALGVVPA